MLRTPDLLLLLCLVGPSDALYKQWIPNTNYENDTNWDKGAVPCGSDIVQFSAGRKVSVFLETAHAVQELRLPLDGEFILHEGAGFYVVSGQDPSCGPGVTAQFNHSDSLQWFDPALWQASETQAELQHQQFLFSVHEESVPCQHDDVVFKALSSFRVDTSSSQSSIPVKSVSVLGETFDSRSEFSQYLSSRSGRLQFHGPSAVTVGNPGCGDPSGCDCGNSVNRQRICSSVTCPALNCKQPLVPAGHCCEVCGAIVTIHYAAGFNLESYRQRIHQLFLAWPMYKSIQLGMSKVLKSQRLMGFVPFGSSPEIQVVIMDGETGELSEALAWEILKDARSHGSKLGIASTELQASSGNNQSGGNAGMVVGIVFGVLIIITLIITAVALIHKGVVQMPPMPSLPSLRSFKRRSDTGDPAGAPDHGYDNPMFDDLTTLSDLPGLNGNELNSISITQTGGVYFVNPVYDEKETDFNA